MLSVMRHSCRLSLVAGLVLLALTGCASLPSLEARVASQAFTDTADTPLGRLAQPPATATATDSGIRPLGDAIIAFTARVALARTAQRSLDVQYYIWHKDATGLVMLEELWKAAERGVRVRLLLDDNGIAGLDPMLAALDRHPNIEVRLFNPFVVRKPKTIGYLTDFRRLNHRMHNKSFTADNSATIIGGRNIGNEYFGAEGDTLFSDLDVLAFGQAARDVSQAFDTYWNSNYAYPAASILRKVTPLAPDAVQAQFAANHAAPETMRYGDAVIARVREERLRLQGDDLVWAPTTLVCDDPAKIGGKVDESGLLMTKLLERMGRAEQSLDIVSPYFVPGKEGTRSLAALARRGVDLRIVTNSLAATDAAVVHAGYAKRREELVKAGVKLYETRPDPAQVDAKGRPLKKEDKDGRGFAFSGSKSSLHAKTFAVDRERIFVGSFNLDQRSVNLNTELGLVIANPGLAGALAQGLDRQLPVTAWEVRLRANGRGLEWIGRDDKGETIDTTDPLSRPGKRFSVWFLSWMPIEWML